MSKKISAQFHSREDAETVVERLVQEHSIERAAIVVAASGSENTAGDERSGADAEAGSPTTEGRGDAPIHGTITISVDLESEDNIRAVQETFAEFNAV